MYLVETNLISEARKGERANANVRAFFAKASDRIGRCFSRRSASEECGVEWI